MDSLRRDVWRTCRRDGLSVTAPVEGGAEGASPR